jgi:hypothetical protein
VPLKQQLPAGLQVGLLDQMLLALLPLGCCGCSWRLLSQLTLHG